MPILTTCSSHRDYYVGPLPSSAYRGVLPAYTELWPTDGPALPFIDATRCALQMAKHQLGHFISPCYPSAADWLAGRDGARCILHWQTADPGFSITWTFEVVASARVLTAAKVDDLVEVYERDRIDQPVAVGVTENGRADRVVRALGFERVSEWDAGGSATVVSPQSDSAEER